MSEASTPLAGPDTPDPGKIPIRVKAAVDRGESNGRPPARVIRLRGRDSGREKDVEPPHINPGVKIEREVIKVSRLMIFGRLLVWATSFFFLALEMLGDRLRGRATKRSDAVRLRRTLERLGPSAIKIGQQLGVRADLVPKEISDELLALLDSVPPFPSAQARAMIEKELGKPINELFSHFDDTPLGSASIACAYKATLMSGDVVAVKVRRPGVEKILAADLDAIKYVCDKLEAIGFISRGKTRPVLREFRQMLLDELNFLVEARQTALFRVEAKKNNRYVSAPRVYGAYSTNKILVTEFITGVFLRVVIEAVQNGDQAFLRDLAANGIDLEKVSRRMVNIFYWQLFEAPFFHADPHPSNVILQPGNKIVMIDLGATGTITQKYRSDLLRFVNSFSKDDLDGMVRNMIASLEPLPPLDMEEYTAEMMHAMREFLFTAKSKSATWQERCSGRAMTAMTELSRRYKIPMRADVLRYFRASFQFDSIVYRLNPKLDSRKEIRRYFAARAREEQKRRRKRLKSNQGKFDTRGLYAFMATAKNRIQDIDNAVAVLAPTVRQITRLFRSRVNKASSIASLAVRFFEVILLVTFVLGFWVYNEQHYGQNFIDTVLDAILLPLFGHEMDQFLKGERFKFPNQVWIWFMILNLSAVFLLNRWARILKTPMSKVEE